MRWGRVVRISFPLETVRALDELQTFITHRRNQSNPCLGMARQMLQLIGQVDEIPFVASMRNLLRQNFSVASAKHLFSQLQHVFAHTQARIWLIVQSNDDRIIIEGIRRERRERKMLFERRRSGSPTRRANCFQPRSASSRQGRIACASFRFVGISQLVQLYLERVQTLMGNAS